MKTNKRCVPLSMLLLVPGLWMLCAIECVGLEPKQTAVISETADLSDLISRIEKGWPSCIKRDQKSNIVSITLPLKCLNDKNLRLVSNIQTLNSLALSYNRELGEPTESGVASLQGASQLRSITLRCCSEMPRGMLEGIASLHQIENLTLTGASPSDRKDYLLLTNMVHLQTLYIYCPSDSRFGREEVSAIASLPRLRKVCIVNEAMIINDCLPLFNSNGITNLLVKGSGWTLQLNR